MGLPKLVKRSDKKKKKILLLADDLRMHSGVANMSREIVKGTINKYDWIQMGGAIKHPEEGKIVDMSESMSTYGDNASLKIYAVSGYGNPQLLREVLDVEQPDAILHFTDPRQWVWMYQMERDIRTKIPIMYYNIWDDLPDPHYNTNFYRSSDTLLAISKQTYGINKRLLKDYDYKDWQIQYIPHGINSDEFNVVDKADTLFRRFEQRTGLDKYKFKVLYINRNIRRKSPGDVALAYKHMMDKLTPEQRKECVLVFHAAPSDENGTDMRTVCSTLLPEYPVIFTHDIKESQSFSTSYLNNLYNSCDVYINLASNEGFGLGSCEMLNTAGVIVVNVTGGLQDQCGFKKDGKYLTEEDYVELGSNHRGEYKEHGEWVKPVFPSNISCQGSPMTPYIFDDRASYEDAGDALLEWYNAGPEERERCGKLGYEFVKNNNIGMDSKEMTNRFRDSIDTTFKEWKPRKRFEITEAI